MLDPRMYREEVDKIRHGLERRGAKVDLDAMVNIDIEKRKINVRLDQLKSERNTATENIANMLQKRMAIGGTKQVERCLIDINDTDLAHALVYEFRMHIRECAEVDNAAVAALVTQPVFLPVTVSMRKTVLPPTIYKFVEPETTAIPAGLMPLMVATVLPLANVSSAPLGSYLRRIALALLVKSRPST